MKHCGYIPPESFRFKSEREALGHLAAALCAVECARFHRHVESRVGAMGDEAQTLAQFAPAYTLIEWAQGIIDMKVYEGRNSAAYQELVTWSNAVVEINTFFRDRKIHDPEAKLMKLGLIHKKDIYGYEPNIQSLGRFLGISLDEKEVAKNFFDQSA